MSILVIVVIKLSYLMSTTILAAVVIAIGNISCLASHKASHSGIEQNEQFSVK